VNRQRVLIAEDDPRVRRSVERALRFEGYEVTTAGDGAAALEAIDAHHPDLIVLDLRMPFVDGMTLCRRLRAGGDRTPILMLTARHEPADRVAGLDAGADDYLIKPFDLEELLARLRALLRRVNLDEPADMLRLGDLVLHPAARRAFRGDRELDLTRTEFDLLETLLVNAGLVLTRDAIYSDVWGSDFEINSNSLDVCVGYLRRKLEAAGEVRLLHTVRGIGYTLREP
jgi:two-component system response regulator MprA